MTCCPTCGQPAPATGLLIDLDANRASCNGVVAQLVPTEAEILVALLRASPGMASHERLADAVWGTLAPERTQNCIKVHVSRLRHKLKPLGIKIETYWGRGYSLKADGEVLKAAKRQASRRRAA